MTWHYSKWPVKGSLVEKLSLCGSPQGKNSKDQRSNDREESRKIKAILLLAGVIFGGIGSSNFGGSFARNNMSLKGSRNTKTKFCVIAGAIFGDNSPSRNDASRGLNLLHLLYGFACRHDSHASLSKVKKKHRDIQPFITSLLHCCCCCCCCWRLEIGDWRLDVCIHNVYAHVSKSSAKNHDYIVFFVSYL